MADETVNPPEDVPLSGWVQQPWLDKIFWLVADSFGLVIWSLLHKIPNILLDFLLQLRGQCYLLEWSHDATKMHPCLRFVCF